MVFRRLRYRLFRVKVLDGQGEESSFHFIKLGTWTCSVDNPDKIRQMRALCAIL